VNRPAAISALVLGSLLVAGCSGASHTDPDTAGSSNVPTVSSSPSWKWHAAIPNDIDPSKVVTLAEAEKLLGKHLPRVDVHNANRNDKFFPSNSRRVTYSNRTSKGLLTTDDYLKVTTKVIDKSLDHDGSRDGNGDIDVNAYGSSGIQTAPLVPAEVGLKDSSSAQAFLVIHGIVDSKRYYPNPTQHDLNNPYGVYIWGDQKLDNGKTRPVRLTISTDGGPTLNRKDLLALATKAVARMNVK